jgi:hypothetical protein
MIRPRIAIAAAIYGVALIIGMLVISGHLGGSIFGPKTATAQVLGRSEAPAGSPLLLCFGWGCNGYTWNGWHASDDYNPCAYAVYGVPCPVPGYHTQVQGFTTCWHCGVQIQNVPINSCWNCVYGTPVIVVQQYPRCWNCGYIEQSYAPQWNSGCGCWRTW